MPIIGTSGMVREITGINISSAMAARASHATNRCCAARFNTLESLAVMQAWSRLKT